MKTRLTSIRDAARGALERALDQLPEFRLSSDVVIPVYMIHQGPDAEDYEILCDFQAFMLANQKSFLARPVLQIWAGRRDFERYLFARHLRQAFSDQFEALREVHRQERDSRGWSFPSVGDVVLWGLSLTSSALGALLLWIATETGRTALGRISAIVRGSMLGRTLAGKSAEDQLEELIEEKKAVIDESLARLEVTLHRDLYAFAWRGQRPGPMTGMDREAWPLPDFVRERMD